MISKLIIFDCDGVLVDSEPLGNAVFSDMLAKYGHSISGEEAVSRFRGMKLGKCLEILERETSIKLPWSFEVDLRRQMSEMFRAHLQPVAGAARLIESLRVPFCVASSGPREKIEENLRTTNLYSHFEGKIFSSYDLESWKPDPDLFLHAAKTFGVSPEDCVVVEDSTVGVAAGVAAGMQVLALDGFGDSGSISGAHSVFMSLDEVYAHLVSLDWAHGDVTSNGRSRDTMTGSN